jgi:hypothetical protein
MEDEMFRFASSTLWVAAAPVMAADDDAAQPAASPQVRVPVPTLVRLALALTLLLASSCASHWPCRTEHGYIDPVCISQPF